MEAIAIIKSAKISPRKVRIVADTLRKLPAKKALSLLSLVEKRGGSVLEQVIRSALANAVNKHMKEDDLIIDTLQVNEGPSIKRFHASTRGRVHPYKKRSTHITVIIKEGKSHGTKN